jgi:predicted membrane chloride channel (bestrophin family)
VLRPDEIDQVMLATHRPNYVLQVLAQLIKEADCGTAATARMDDNLTAFEDVLGGCERILKTPVPLSYTRHTSRFLMIWLTLLPFSLYKTAGLATVPVSMLIAFLLLGIEEIGVSIEGALGFFLLFFWFCVLVWFG